MRSSIHLIAIAVITFGGAWPITKAALSDATPMWFAAGRAGLAALVGMALIAVVGRLRLPKRGDMPAVLALGLLQLGTFFVLAHAAAALVTASRVAIISAVTSYWLIPMSVVLLGERVSRQRWVAAALGLAGVACLTGPWSVDWTSAEQILGHGMLMAAALLWSIAIITTRRWPPPTPVLELLPWCFSLATLFLVPVALIVEPGGGIGSQAWPYMLYIGLVAAPIGTWCVVEVGRRLPGAVASVAFLLVPAFGVIVSALWLGDPLGWDVVIGSLLIVLSVVLAAWG